MFDDTLQLELLLKLISRDVVLAKRWLFGLDVVEMVPFLGPFFIVGNLNGHGYLDLIHKHILHQLIETFRNQFDLQKWWVPSLLVDWRWGIIRCISGDCYLKKQLYGLFLWMGFNCLKATEPLRGDSLLFTSRSTW